MAGGSVDEVFSDTSRFSNSPIPAGCLIIQFNSDPIHLEWVSDPESYRDQSTRLSPLQMPVVNPGPLTFLTDQVQTGISYDPLSRFYNLLEWLTELRKHFPDIFQLVIKDTTQEQHSGMQTPIPLWVHSASPCAHQPGSSLNVIMHEFAWSSLSSPTLPLGFPGWG